MLKLFIRDQWIQIPLHPVDNPTGLQIGDGDDRDNKPGANVRYRAAQRISVRTHPDLDQGMILGTKENLVGPSKLYNRGSAVPFSERPCGPDNRLLPGAVPLRVGTADTSRMKISDPVVSGSSAEVEFSGAAGNPLITLSADIDWKVKVKIDCSDVLNPKWMITGSHDNFPAYEVDIVHFVNSIFQPYWWLHPLPGDVWSLLPGGSISVATNGDFPSTL